ncbi:MAG TPA: DUF2937 family protein [Devosia sp.]|mgnify:CR=1 FL=1|nr:DUF2937 family protein [Devosia sp.]
MRKTLSAVGGLALGLMLSQFPEYAQQYTQRLGGAVDELRIITAEFDAAATAAGLTREDALARYTAAGDSFLADRGTSMAATFRRYDALSAALVEIQGATGWERFTELPKYLDSDIGTRTMQAFKPGVPVTMEGFAYAGAGFLLGYFITSGFARFLGLPFRRRRRWDDEDDLPPPRTRRNGEWERKEPTGI